MIPSGHLLTALTMNPLQIAANAAFQAQCNLMLASLRIAVAAGSDLHELEDQCTDTLIEAARVLGVWDR